MSDQLKNINHSDIYQESEHTDIDFAGIDLSIPIFFVCSNLYNQYIRNMSSYKQELGMSYTSKQGNSTVVDIKDKFVIDYYNTYNRLVYKVAEIGNVTVYTDSNLVNTCIKCKNGNFEEKDVDYIEAKFNIEKNFVELVFI